MDQLHNDDITKTCMIGHDTIDYIIMTSSQNLYGGGVTGHANNDGGDALVEQGHGCGGVNERDERFHQFLAQPRLQRSQRSKLQREREGREGEEMI